MGRADELMGLVGEQAAELARESRTRRLPRHRGEVRLSELPPAERERLDDGRRWDPDLMRRVPAPPRQWAVYLYGCDPAQWAAAAHPSSRGIHDPGPGGERGAAHLAAHFARVSCPIRCPVCLGRPLPRGWYCLACDAAGLDALDADPSVPFGYRGEPVGSRYDFAYLRDAGLLRTVYRRDPKGRRGGTG